MKKKYDYLIVGAGLYGSTFANEAKKCGKTCLVIDKRNHIGGNVYTQSDEGINVHKYGAHIFHTNNKEIWDYVNNIVPFNNFINSPLANYKGTLYNLPFNMNTFNKLWNVKTPAEAKAKIQEQCCKYANIEPKNLEEQVLKFCGKDIYQKLIKGYTEKQWGCVLTQLPIFIIKRVPIRFTYNNNYFDDMYQGIPIGGYTKMIEAMLDGVDVQTNCNFFENRKELENIATTIIYTGCIDEFFNYEHGHLQYRSLRFEEEHLPIYDFQGNAVVNYTDKETPFTRIIEHKHFEFGTQPTTIITREYPETYDGTNEPYYPIHNAANIMLLNEYEKMAVAAKNVYFGGRLGQYSYFDMDDIIAEVLKNTKAIFNH